MAVAAAVVGALVADPVAVVAVVAAVPPVVDVPVVAVAARTTGADPPVVLGVDALEVLLVVVVAGTVDFDDGDVVVSGGTVTEVRLDVVVTCMQGPCIVARCETTASHSNAGECEPW